MLHCALQPAQSNIGAFFLNIQLNECWRFDIKKAKPMWASGNIAASLHNIAPVFHDSSRLLRLSANLLLRPKSLFCFLHTKAPLSDNCPNSKEQIQETKIVRTAGSHWYLGQGTDCRFYAICEGIAVSFVLGHFLQSTRTSKAWCPSTGRCLLDHDTFVLLEYSRNALWPRFPAGATACKPIKLLVLRNKAFTASFWRACMLGCHASKGQMISW